MTRRHLGVAIVAVVVFALPAPALAAGPFGALRQLGPRLGCISRDGSSEDGANTCANGRALGGAEDAAVSPDGRNVYVGAGSDEAVAVFRRNPANGALTQLPGTAGCVSNGGSSEDGPNTCGVGHAIPTDFDGQSFAFSRDGRFVYLAGYSHPAIVIFSRNTSTGALTQLAGKPGCWTQDGSSADGPNTCNNGRSLTNIGGAVISPDAGGKNLYVTTEPGSGTANGVSSFTRNPTTGTLSQLPTTSGCITNGGASEVGPNTCGNGKAMRYPQAPVISPDGKNVYISGYTDESIAVLTRDPATGVLSQSSTKAGCVSSDGNSDAGADTCADGRAIFGPYPVAVSPNGKNVYAGLYDDVGVVSFSRNSSGQLTQLDGTAGCITDDGSSEDGPGTCQVGRGTSEAYALTIAADGRSAYEMQLPNGLAALSRDPVSGKLSPLPGIFGCLSVDGASVTGPGTCINARALGFASGLAVAPDGLSVYVPGGDDNAVSVFTRQAPPRCSGGVVGTGTNKPLTVALRCTDPNGDVVTRSIVGAPAHGSLGPVDNATGTVEYTPSKGYSGADSFSFRATDGGLSSTVASEGVTVADTLAASCKPTGTAHAKRVRHRVLKVKLRCSEAARVSARLYAGRKAARKLHVARSKRSSLGKGSARARKKGTITLKIKLSRKAAKIRKLSKRRLRKLHAVLKVKTRDKAGNRSSRTLKLKLGR